MADSGTCVTPSPSEGTVPVAGKAARSFVKAALEKFNGETDVDETSDFAIYVPRKGPAKITDSGHLLLPCRVHMDSCGITEAGECSDITAMCRHVTELDLSHNHFTSLGEVLRLIRCIPHLTFLNLTSNPLSSESITMATNAKATPIPDAEPDSTAVNSRIETAGDANAAASASTAVTATTNDNDNFTCENSTTTPSPNKDIITCGNFASKTGTTTPSNDITCQSLPAATTSTETPSNDNTNTTATIPSTTPSSDDNITANNNHNNSMFRPPLAGAGEEGDLRRASSCDCALVFPGVRQLVLNATHLQWPAVVRLLHIFPSLEELHLSMNGYGSVELPPRWTYPPLTALFFSNAALQQWDHVLRLGRAFPHLTALFLPQTSLASLQGADGTRLEQGEFGTLQTLSLSRTALGGWGEVEALRRLPALTDLRLQGVPFLEAIKQKERRQQLVARLPGVTRLNGSPVTADERVQAERAFLRLHMDREDKPQRYFELEAQHGRPATLAQVDMRPQSVLTMAVILDQQSQTLELDSSQTARQLKKTLQNVARVPSNQFDLYYNDLRDNHGPTRMMYPDRKLYAYRMDSGNEIIIVKKFIKEK